MIKAYTHTGQAINIPERIEDVTVKQWVQIRNGADVMETLIGIHSDNLSEQAAAVIWSTMRWMQKGCLDFEPKRIDIDTYECSYNAYRQSTVMIQHFGQINALPFIYAAYTTLTPFDLGLVNKYSDEVEDMPAVEIIPSALWLLSHIGEMSAKWAKMLSKQPKAIEVKAGIKSFDPFGDFGAIFNLSGRDLEKADRLRNRPFNEILTSLYYLRVESEFNERYHQEQLRESKNKKHGK